MIHVSSFLSFFLDIQLCLKDFPSYITISNIFIIHLCELTVNRIFVSCLSLQFSTFFLPLRYGKGIYKILQSRLLPLMLRRKPIQIFPVITTYAIFIHFLFSAAGFHSIICLKFHMVPPLISVAVRHKIMYTHIHKNTHGNGEPYVRRNESERK